MLLSIKEELKKETDPEVLRQFSLWLHSRNQQLEETIARWKKEEFEDSLLNLPLQDQLTTLRKMMFGKSSEKREHPDRPRDPEKDKQLTLQSQSLVPQPKPEETRDLGTGEVIHEMSPEELVKEGQAYDLPEVKATDFEEIKGLTEDSTEITIVERTYKMIKHRRKKYRYKPSQENPDLLGKELIVTAPGPEKLLPGATYSLDFAVSVVSDKYLYHLPLERQRRMMEQNGLGGMTTGTLYNLCQAVAVHLEPVAEKIRGEILACDRAVGCDETPWPILQKDHDDGYLWSISNQAGSFYRFEPTRSGKVIEEILQGYQGPIMSDGYVGYNRLKKIEGIILANCWSHVRRKFYDIRETYPQDCKTILDWIDRLFAIEHEAKNWAHLQRLRKEESEPLTKEILAWLMEKKSKYLSQSGFTKAVNYALNHWVGLTGFLKDPKIPLSNNDTERALRHGVMGRKNYYGSKTINGADVAATLFTVIETCKKMELNPTAYLRYVLVENHHRREPLTPMQYAKQIRAA